MITRVVKVGKNTVTLHIGREAGEGYCVCTVPCPAGDVTSERSYRRMRGSTPVCTRAAPPGHINEFHSVFSDSLECRSAPARYRILELLRNRPH